MLIVEGAQRAALLNAVIRAEPREAVGLLTNDRRVIPLPNRAYEPENTFSVTKEDILSAIRGHEIEDLTNLTLWHSHPGGGVGPSKVDMQQKVPFLDHLVVTIVEDDIVLTWY